MTWGVIMVRAVCIAVILQNGSKATQGLNINVVNLIPLFHAVKFLNNNNIIKDDVNYVRSQK